MAFGVLMHKPDSIYDDVPSEQYQFPKQYLSRMEQFLGDWVLYLEPSKVKNSKGYFAVARIQDVIADPSESGMFLAIIEAGSYLDFGDAVSFNQDGAPVERGLLNEQGKLSGRAQSAVRPVSAEDFHRIIALGLGASDDILPRDDLLAGAGMADVQTEFLHPAARAPISQMVNRKRRDANFRKAVLRAYGERCAITGLRLINGGGRAEVEAAHIRPVKFDGPDITSNGIALSGTAHWMFDRGLVGLDDDLRILVSRQSNDPVAVGAMINETGGLLVPNRLADQPRREFVTWHREHCFKA